jgi:hypothetical protein
MPEIVISATSSIQFQRGFACSEMWTFLFQQVWTFIFHETIRNQFWRIFMDISVSYLQNCWSDIVIQAQFWFSIKL